MTSPQEAYQKAMARRQAYIDEYARRSSPAVASPVVSSQTAAVDTSSFPYGSDVGVDSVPGILLLARSSGLEITVISSYRTNANGYHKTNAVDFGGSQGLQRQLAAYLYQFSPYILELIHTDPGVPGGGFYVNNGKKVPQSFYDGPDIDNPASNIIQRHVNHVHCAMTMSGLRAASANSEQIAAQALAEAARQKPPAAGQNTNLLTGDSAASINAARDRSRNKGCASRVGVAAAALVAILATPIGLLVYFL